MKSCLSTAHGYPMFRSDAGRWPGLCRPEPCPGDVGVIGYPIRCSGVQLFGRKKQQSLTQFLKNRTWDIEGDSSHPLEIESSRSD
ncbi:sulfotransferase family 1B-like protein [Anopheles sinensis]|uniref:Sulfotransferase family 1B-like protein n=1 Tax=Anopheles sinensis TaxID=74873 RepID=A0A084WFM9_ANOSI|nr:sulfotransferase family 1B-like protein [Anopheles sinensis]